MLTRVALPGVAAILLGAVAFDTPLAGKWSGETYADGATARVTIELFPNGTYARRVVTTTEFGWTLLGDTLLVAPAMLSANNEVTYGKASAMLLRFSGDSLIASSRGQSMPLHRVTWPVKDAPLLGRWQGQSDLNEGITQDFTADGKLVVDVTLSTEAGRYTADESTISWETQIPMPGRKKTRYRLENGKLFLYLNAKLPPIELQKAAADSSAR
jgi:hypothetical protein